MKKKNTEKRKEKNGVNEDEDEDEDGEDEKEVEKFFISTSYLIGLFFSRPAEYPFFAFVFAFCSYLLFMNAHSFESINRSKKIFFLLTKHIVL